MSKKSYFPTVTTPYERYLQEIQKFPLLSREEEHELARRYYETGDLKIAHKLVTANLRFVIKIANEYAAYGLRVMDLIQEGNIGLMKAVKTFNPYKNTRLITYAVWWIRSYIHDYIQHSWSLVKIGTTQSQRKLFYKLRQEKAQLEQMGLGQNIKLLSERLGVKEKEIQEMEGRLSARDVSLDTPFSEEGKALRLDFLEDQQKPADEVLGEEEQKELFLKRLKEFKTTLNDRNKFILEQRLLSETPMTLQDIGDKFGITKERARQLEEKILKNLKAYIVQKEKKTKRP